MPSKSRKKIKGQARKAKAKAAADVTANNSEHHENVRGRSLVHLPNHCNSFCYHGQAKHTPDVCVQFITSFFHSYECIMTPQHVKNALKAAYAQVPEAVNSNINRDILKKSLVSNGASALLGMCGTHNAQIAYGAAVALMLIDSFGFSDVGMDAHDANNYLRNADIINGCKRSLVKYFMKQIPCKCLDDLYSQLKLSKPKTGMCAKCEQTKERSELFICTGCKRVMYCSKACQIEHVHEHKEFCKLWQMYECTENPEPILLTIE